MRLMRLKELCFTTGYPESTAYALIKDGLLPTQISLGARSVAWLESEILSVMKARISGASNEEVKNLVAELIENRSQIN